MDFLREALDLAGMWLDAFLLSTPNAKLGKSARALKRRVEKAKASAAAEAPAESPAEA